MTAVADIQYITTQGWDSLSLPFNINLLTVLTSCQVLPYVVGLQY